MAKLLFIGTCGSEDPTRASFPFIAAKGALEANIECSIVLNMEGVVLMRDRVAENIVPMGWPPLKEFLKFAVDAKVPIYV